MYDGVANGRCNKCKHLVDDGFITSCRKHQDIEKNNISLKTPACFEHKFNGDVADFVINKKKKAREIR